MYEANSQKITDNISVGLFMINASSETAGQMIAGPAG